VALVGSVSPASTSSAVSATTANLDSRCGNCVEVSAGRRFIGVGM
jgi:hypothetical protein